MSSTEIGGLVGHVLDIGKYQRKPNVLPAKKLSNPPKPNVPATKKVNDTPKRSISPFEVKAQHVLQQLSVRSKPVGELLAEAKQVLLGLQKENKRLEQRISLNEKETTTRIRQLEADYGELWNVKEENVKAVTQLREELAAMTQRAETYKERLVAIAKLADASDLGPGSPMAGGSCTH